MKANDSLRKWIWWFLGGIAALQFYFVRELLAAFALFALGFVVIGLCLGALYSVQKGWEAGVGRLAASQNGWILATRRGVATVEEWGRPASAPAPGFRARALILFGLFRVSQSTGAGITAGVR